MPHYPAILVHFQITAAQNGRERGRRRAETGGAPLRYVEDFLRDENEVGGHFQQPLLADGDELPDPRPKTSRVSALDVHETRPAEPADKSFARSHAGNPAGGGLFDVVRSRGGPGHQVAIVHDVFLIRLQLDFMNGPEAVQDERPLAADLQDEEPLATQ